MKYIDAHAHLNSDFFKEEVEEAIKKAQDLGVKKMVMPSTSKKDSLASIALAKKYDFLFATVGLHPSDIFDVKECDFLDDINPDDIVAVGEAGIDLYRDTNPPLETQKQVFAKHIEFAKKNDKVLIIHMRSAESEVYEMLKKYAPLKFVMHSFHASYEWAMKFIDLGGYISLSGIVTFKNAPSLKDVAKRIPLDRITCETDAPFLTPVPFRGKLNTPGYVKYVADYVAEIRPENDEDVIEQIFANTEKLFSI